MKTFLICLATFAIAFGLPSTPEFITPTNDGTTPEPTTIELSTSETSTSEPSTPEPTTPEPTTLELSTLEPTTPEPTTPEPTTLPPTTTTSRYHSNYHNDICNFTACVEPECQCLNDRPPKGLAPEIIPQFVMITFDGAVTVTNFPFYKDLFTYKNPNGCPVQATYFVSHVDTNYKLVHELHRRGNEIGAHSISKSKNNYQDYWKNLNFIGWKEEFGGQRRIISKYADIPLTDIKGARAPNLQTSGNITIAALVSEDYEYDCSSPTRAGIKTPFFPYTLDYGGQRGQDCPVQPCVHDDEHFPGFWEVPMNDLNVNYVVDNANLSRECATAAGCLLFNEDGTVNYTPTEDQIYNLFLDNFKRFYNGNKAPFPLYLSEDWIQQEGKRNGLFKFIETISKEHKDVYFVTIDQVIEWMKTGATAAEYEANTKCKPITNTKCMITDLDDLDLELQYAKHCDFEKVGELGGLTKRMVICNEASCPDHYPWTGRS